MDFFALLVQMRGEWGGGGGGVCVARPAACTLLVQSVGSSCGPARLPLVQTARLARPRAAFLRANPALARRPALRGGLICTLSCTALPSCKAPLHAPAPRTLFPQAPLFARPHPRVLHTPPPIRPALHTRGANPAPPPSPLADGVVFVCITPPPHSHAALPLAGAAPPAFARAPFSRPRPLARPLHTHLPPRAPLLGRCVGGEGGKATSGGPLVPYGAPLPPPTAPLCTPRTICTLICTPSCTCMPHCTTLWCPHAPQSPIVPHSAL